MQQNKNRRKKSILWQPSKEEFQEIVYLYNTTIDVLRHFNLKNGNTKTFKARVKEDNIDISHFTSWNKGKVYTKKKYTIGEIFVIQDEHRNINGKLKKILVDENIVDYKCKRCGLFEWQNEKLSLELDHINGNNCDNRLENLRFLCPNCHSLTDTWRGRNINRSFEIKNYDNKEKEYSFDNQCIDCNVGITNRSKRCHSCSNKFKSIKTNKNKTKPCPKCEYERISIHADICANCRRYRKNIKSKPSLEQLEDDVNKLGYTGTGRKYEVSDTSIRNWIKQYKNI